MSIGLYEFVKAANENQSLVGKPKIFFIIACRGGKCLSTSVKYTGEVEWFK